MPSSKKPRHKRRVKTTGSQTLRTQPWKTEAAFRPLEAILDELEQQGTMTVVAHGCQAGLPVFRPDGEDTWYAAAPALRGFIETFEIHQLRSGRAMPLDALRRLATKFEVGMPVFDSDTREVRQALQQLRRESYGLPIDYASDLVQVTRIATELENLKEAV